MNKTKIDWADVTWNPITGCYHNCEYCYARKIANRFGNKYVPFGCGKIEGNVLNVPMDGEKGIDPYPYGFEPTFHYYRLDDPQKTKKQQNIFVCSMADLFGDWVPDKWIQMVFNACGDAPQHRYLFLTKNPERYVNLASSILPQGDMFWYGSTATDGDKRFWHYAANHKTFLSIEPIMGRFDLPPVSIDVDWVIVGAETGNRKNKIMPDKTWIDEISMHCAQHGIPIFMKDSIRRLMGSGFKQEFPWRTDT